MTEQHIRQTHLTPDEIEAAADPSATLPEPRREHVRACASCAGEVAELRRLSAALAALPSLAPRAGFSDRVMARVSLPVPWHRRLAAAVRERSAAGIGIAATLAALIGGAGLWAVQFPELRPMALVGWLAGHAGDLLWQVTLAAGRTAYAMGFTDVAAALQADFSLASALAALATIALVGIGAATVMIRLVRYELPELVRAR